MKDMKLGEFSGSNSTKNVREPQISYSFNEAFHVLIRIFARLAGRLMTQLSRFPTLRGSLFFWHRLPRYAGNFLFDIDNRVEIQKLNQVAAELPPGWVFGVQLGLWQIQALIYIKKDIKGKTRKNNYVQTSSWNFIFFRGWNGGKNVNFFIFWLRASRRVFKSFLMFHCLIHLGRKFHFLPFKLLRLKFDCQNTWYIPTIFKVIF